MGWRGSCDRLGLALDDPDVTRTDALEPLIHPAAGEENQTAARALEDAGKLIALALTGLGHRQRGVGTEPGLHPGAAEHAKALCRP